MDGSGAKRPLSMAEDQDAKRVRFDANAASAAAQIGDQVALTAAASTHKLRANDIVELRFVRAEEDIGEQGAAGAHDEKLVAHPTYLHQIIPKEEVFGWESISVAVYVSLTSLHTWVDTHKVPASTVDNDGTAVEETDVEALLLPFIKSGRVPSRTQFCSAVAEEFTPPVEKCVHTYERGGRKFGVYKEKLSKGEDLAEYHRRMAFLMFVHIDGASYIDDQDPRWEIFVILEHIEGKPRYFVGYATTYPFVAMRKGKGGFSAGFTERIRISQVLILPLLQGGGHGGELLTAIYQDALAREAMEVTVEDPSPGFRLLRDLTDLRRCYAAGVLLPEKPLTADAEEQVIEQIRTKLLVTCRQARRCVEVHQLRHVDVNDDDAYKKYRLWVKRRLHNYYLEVLDVYGEDKEQKKAKLAEIYSDYEAEYRNVIDRFDARKSLGEKQ